MKHVPSVVEKYRLRRSGNDPHTDTPSFVPSHPIAVNQTHFSGLAICEGMGLDKFQGRDEVLFKDEGVFRRQHTWWVSINYV